MNARTAVATFGEVARNGLGVPLLVMVVLAMMVLPLPAFLLDVFFTFNISLSLMILLAVIYVRRALEFATFPTVLLGATLLRLGLNVASTRIVLINGHTGSQAAGHVIAAFGHFVVGGNYAVGMVVFTVLVIINFVVITKGAGRISEVSARFTLDAMPGRQMAIDADLNAGIITQADAIIRRQEVREEADFYGAMDGASKFVRGDAIAGILVVFINLFGGTIIGAAQHGMPLADAGRTYALLTIGDGLVAQIPALLLSVAVAILVTRVSRPHDMSQQIMAQVLGQPRALGVTSGILALLGIIPGMPNFVFLAMAAVCAVGAYFLSKRPAPGKSAAAVPAAAAAAVPAEQKELSWDDVEQVDLIGLEVGYRLIPLVDRNQGGELMGRIKGVRKKLSEELGFLVQAVHIRDNLELGPNSYRITILGAPVGESEVFPDRELAINPGQVAGSLPGSATKDPAFGLDAIWVEKSRREQAQAQGYTVVDASSVIATHLSHLLQSHAHELLGHEEVQQLLNRLSKSAPKLIEDLVPKLLPMSAVVKVLQYLLLERVSIRNLRTICETLAELAPKSQDPVVLVAAVRVALGRSIVQNIGGLRQELPVITLDPALEQVLQDSMAGGGDASPGFEPGLADRIQTALGDSTRRQEAAGEPAVLLVAPKIRPWIARLMRHSTPALSVLAYNEIPENRRIRVIAAVGR
ncbi:MAG TPA: flagellar biosynthesis protein FlhA [Steroidobacteraceae bacterium]|jgi:flagellar biosynthesis protein FlhA|nr:flagellar biosynthesis protein FlhA [Steroidobacteraceae bacterium]